MFIHDKLQQTTGTTSPVEAPAPTKLTRGGKRRLRLVSLLTGVMLVLATPAMAAPATAAPGEKHGSCADFGASFAAWAQGELPPEAGRPGTGMPALAQTEPGHAAFILHLEMTEEEEVSGIPDTPFCDPHPTE